MNVLTSRKVLRISIASSLIALVGSVCAAGPTVAVPGLSSQVTTVAETFATDSDEDGTLDAPNTVAAAAGAVSADQPVEDLSQRTESTAVVANPDHTWTSKDFGEPVRIKRDGKWVDVDYTLTKQDDGSWAPKAAPVDVSIDGGSSKEAASVTFDDGSSVAVTWPDALPDPTIDGGVATYKLSKAVDLVVAVTGSGVATRIRLNQAPTADDPVYQLGLTTEGLKLDETAAGGIKATDSDGKSVGSTATLVAWDSHTDHAGEPAEIVPVDATLDQTSSKGTGGDAVRTHDLELSAPAEILDDPNVKFPVILDPDINAITQWRDTWVRYNTTALQGNSYRLLVGSIGGDSNPYPAFSYLQWWDTQFTGKDIVSATMGVYQYDAGSCSPKDMYIHPLTSGFTEGSTVYSNKPANSSTTGDSVTVTANRARTGCAVGNGYTTANITKMVSSWASGKYENYGVQLNAPTAVGNDTSYERRFCSWEPDTSQTQTPCTVATHMPYLSVTYNTPPATTATPAVVATTTPASVSVPVSDPDGGAVRAKFVVKKDTAVVVDQFSTYVTSGQNATLTLPKLAPGSYTVSARANDGSAQSATDSGPASFTVPAADATYTPDLASTVVYDSRNDSPIGPGEERVIDVEIPAAAGIPEGNEVNETAYTLTALNWTDGGSAKLYNVDLDEPAISAISFAGSGTSLNVGNVTTSVVNIGDGELAVRNTSTADIDVVLKSQGWFSADPEIGAVDDGSDDVLGPNPLPQAMTEAPADSLQTFTFDLPVEGAFTLSDGPERKVTLHHGGVNAGEYTAMAVDDAGNPVTTSLHGSGQQLVQVVTPSPDTEYPVTVTPIFEASDPDLTQVQDLYPPLEDFDSENQALQPTDPVEITDDGMADFVAGLQEPEQIVATNVSAASSSNPYVPVPKKTVNGKVVKQKYYYYDPDGLHPRRLPWKKGWHDYCTKSADTYSGASFKGPCARHDLCIEFKEAPDRTYCDVKLKADMRTNCYYKFPQKYLAAAPRSICYGLASIYYKVVSKTTSGYSDPDHWGHSGIDYYPQFNYYQW